MECRRIAELLVDYLEGTLSKPTVELIEWHIDGCAPCVAFVNTYRGTVDVKVPYLDPAHDHPAAGGTEKAPEKK